MFHSRPGFCQRLFRIGFATLAGFGILTAYAKEPVMSETKTYCVGRFLVDAPKDAEINGQGYEFIFGRIESERTGIDAKNFAARMEKREDELRAGKQKDKFKLAEVLSPSVDSRIFKLSRAFDLFPNDLPSTGLEAYRLSHGTVFSMAATGFGQSFPQLVERLKSVVLPAVRSRQPEEIPTEPGFCIKDGFIADDGSKDQAEYGQIGFCFKAWPDVLIVFTTRENGDKLDDTLPERYAKSPIHTEYADVIGRIKTFRKGDRKVGSLAGEELVQAYPTDAGYFIHQFAWDSPGKPNAAFSPNVHVEMFTGQGHAGERTVRPSLTDDQAIKLFDSIVNSIRLRPTGPAKVTSAEPTPSSPQKKDDA